MKDLALIGVPAVAAGVAFTWRTDRTRPYLLPIAGVVHFALSLALLLRPPEPIPDGWLGFDPVARAVLPMVSLLFMVCAFYGVAYLRARAERPNRVFVGSLLGLLALLSLALQAQHLGLLWVAAETATLITVPLLHFNGTARAFEATWKYLLVGGTGIALSLLGSFCLGYASLYGGGSGDLTFAALTLQGAELGRPWLVTAWVLLLTGYGTKMGLAPMHTWKPDVYGEAPGVVGALLAGGMTTMAFVAILRVKQVVVAAGAGGMADRTLLCAGLFSMAVAALFLLGTPDFKRMLAYSSVEHMGILIFGAALGAPGLWAALFHLWNNGLAKGALFLSAGNLRRAAGASRIEEVAGMAWRTPSSARLFLVGILAVTACPPFGPFFSALLMVRTGLAEGRGPATAFFLFCLLLAFVGATRVVLAVVDGRPRAASAAAVRPFHEGRGLLAPPWLFLALTLALGLATPSLLTAAWDAAVQQLVSPP